MYATHYLMVIHPCAKYDKFDLEVKVQGRIWIVNARDTSSYGGTPRAKYGNPVSNHKKVMGRKRICTDRQTK